MMQLIPAIDLRQGRCVRLLQGNFDQETHYDVAPAELFERYRKLGAQWVHVVDLDGARDGDRGNRAIIEGLAASGGPKLQVGGGVREEKDVQDLIAAGVRRIVVGSTAVRDPARVRSWVETFGTDCIVAAFDVRLDAELVPRVATHGWRDTESTSLWEAIDAFHGSLLHVLCTDIARDGALSGPNLSLYEEAQRRYPQILWQASGGIRSAADLGELQRRGLTAAISGRALLDQRLTGEEVAPFLPNASSPA